MDNNDPDGQKALIDALRMREMICVAAFLKLLAQMTLKGTVQGHGHQYAFAITRRALDILENDFRQMHIDDQTIPADLKIATAKAQGFNLTPPAPTPDA